MNLVFLPVAAPLDEQYGRVPSNIEEFPRASIHTVRYPTLVWYNEHVRNEAIKQIRDIDAAPLVLIGFSKSGLGAWNIARAIPDIISATIIFDAPVARQELPTWGTAPFYDGDAAWQKDSPMNTIEKFRASVPKSHSLILISGQGFRDEMVQMSQALSEHSVEHSFIDMPNQKHHWNSGWIEEGLRVLGEQ